ncbi:MAG TPA: type II CAAX endopeptidase family protein [Candidatus Saccharimonadales bacterium]|jgi:membrane protease YdiL (CAAX protease family)|nr:type II CAAX endopeptidase family protein [Candidatus Saccharimonadales bacterium]
MSASSSNSSSASAPDVSHAKAYRWWRAIALPAWVFVSFILAQMLVIVAITLPKALGIDLSGVNSSVLETVAAAIIYLLCFSIIVTIPLWVRRLKTSRKDIGLTRLPSWMDLGLAPAGFVIYLLLSGLMMYAVSQLVSGFDASESQDIGFQNLTQGYEYALAFVTLVMIAPIAEEAIFRGYLYGKLRKSVPIWAAMLVTSLLFGFLHMKWDGGWLAGANVGLDVFILSVVMCGLREATGSIWAGIVLHMMKNGLAFYLLFINPTLLTTMGG